MLDHIPVGVTDLERSRRFYDTASSPLGLARTVDFQGRGSDYGTMAGQYGVEFTITVEGRVSPLSGNVPKVSGRRAIVRSLFGTKPVTAEISGDRMGPGLFLAITATSRQPPVF
jgi:hypothetical protein